jgi:DNA polymerase-3 subunit chi
MKEINIYKVSQSNFLKMLTKLVESIVNQNQKIYLLCNSQEQEKQIDDVLWSYSQLSFIPHATSSDPYLADQLVIIGTDPYMEPDNKPEILLVVDDSKSFNDQDVIKFLINQYQKVLVLNIFSDEHYTNAEDPSSLFFQATKSLNMPVNFIEQDLNGKWIKKPL